MNQEPVHPLLQNPWKNKDALHSPKPIVLAFAAVLFLLSSLELVFFGSELFSMLVFGILCAGTILLLRMPRLSVLPLMTAILPIVLLRSFTLGALVLAVVVGVSCGAMLLTTSRSPYRTVILPLAAWAIVYVATKDVGVASLTLLLVPAAVLLAVATRMHQRRTAVIILTTVGLLLSVLSVFAAYLVLTYGTVNADVIRTCFDAQRAELIRAILATRDDTILLLQEQMGEQASETVSMLMSTMNEETVTIIIAMLYNILPALVTVVASILAFEAQSCLCGMYLSSGMKEVLTPVSTAFTMSTTSASLYLCGFFVLLFAPASSLFTAAVQNVYLILTPGLMLIGWTATTLRYRMSKGGSRTMFLVLCVGLCLLNPTSIPSLLAFVGAATVLISALGMRWMQKMQARMGAEEFRAWRDQYTKQNPMNPQSPEEPSEKPREDAPEESGEPDGTEEHKEPTDNDRDDHSDGAE